MNLRTLRITRRAADRLRAGHLWVYRSDLEPPSRAAVPHQPPSPGAPGSPVPVPADTLPGELVTLTDSRNIPLGTAMYSTASQIAARLVSRTPALSREQYLADVRTRIAAALELRRTLSPAASDNPQASENNAQRLIFAEADNLPGIVADRYNDLVLLQLLTQGTAQDDVRRAVVDALRAGLTTADLTIWERPDPRIREIEQLAPPPAGPLFTSVHSAASRDREHAAPGSKEPAVPARSAGDESAAPTITIFTLNGLRFHYDAASGQKTGAFLDQSLNYAAAARAVVASASHGLRDRSYGPRALDICTYHGGFALHLAAVCAQVTGVDASRAALEAADRNLLLNPQLSSRCEVDWIEADAFEYLRHLDDTARAARNSVHPSSTKPVISTASAAGAERPADFSGDGNPHLFDVIVLDPPAFAKSKRAAEGALRGYKELNLRALRLLAPGGTLITCSCSHHVSLADFTAVVAEAAADAGRRVQLLETRAAAPDHPEVLTLPETRYLKCLICRVD
jgi:23S rRNA (cytosine1962-C5)-methyltransferase